MQVDLVSHEGDGRTGKRATGLSQQWVIGAAHLIAGAQRSDTRIPDASIGFRVGASTPFLSSDVGTFPPVQDSSGVVHSSGVIDASGFPGWGGSFADLRHSRRSRADGGNGR
jgi:hypothetical protein